MHVGHFGYEAGWVDAAIVPYFAAFALGAVGGQRPKWARRLAASLAERDAPVTDELRALLDDRVSRVENYTALLVVLAILAVVVFKP